MEREKRGKREEEYLSRKCSVEWENDRDKKKRDYVCNKELERERDHFLQWMCEWKFRKKKF